MHSVIAMDENDQPLTPCITWADNRSEAWAHKIKDELNTIQFIDEQEHLFTQCHH